MAPMAELFTSSIAARSVHSVAPSLFVPPVSHTPFPGVASAASPDAFTIAIVDVAKLDWENSDVEP